MANVIGSLTPIATTDHALGIVDKSLNIAGKLASGVGTALYYGVGKPL